MKKLKFKKFLKIKFYYLLGALLAASYSTFWVYHAYEARDILAKHIKTYNDEHKSLKIKYDTISISGFPFTFNFKLINPKAEIDSSGIASLLAGFIDKSDNPFPKFAHQAKLQTINQPIIVKTNFLQKTFNITLPKEIISNHSLENRLKINLMHTFNDNVTITISHNDKIINGQSKKLNLFEIPSNLMISIPSYSVYDLNGYKIINSSKGMNFSLTGYAETAKITTYQVAFSDCESLYYSDFIKILKGLMSTAFFKHLQIVSPIFYADLANTSSYLQAGRNKLNMEFTYTIDKSSFDLDNTVEYQLNLQKFEQTNEFGSISGTAQIKAAIDFKADTLKMINNVYLASVLNHQWYQKWVDNIINAFTHIKASEDIWHKKLIMLLPKAHHSNFITLDFKTEYEKYKLFSSPYKFGTIALDHLKLQTDEFLVNITKGPEYGEDLKKLPLNFNIKLYNYQKLIQAGWDYLNILLNTTAADNVEYKVAHEDLIRLIKSLSVNSRLTEQNLESNIKYEKGNWHFNGKNIPAIQSELISIILNHRANK